MPELSTEAGTHPQCDKESDVKMREPLNTEMNSKNKRRLIDSNLIAQTKRLFIRKIEVDDQDLIYSLYQETSLSSSPAKDDKFTELYHKVFWNETNRPNIYNGMIFLNCSGAFVGRICMQHIDSPLPELGIDIMKAYQNQGYGPEAIVAFCNWYSAKFGLHKIKVRIQKENTHSIHIFEKLGAEYNVSSPYFSNEILDVLKTKLPHSDLSSLTQNNIRDYLLQLPIIIDK